ncbi:hypothetical protein KR009_005148, partial [Drosophila setifemur]
IDTHVTFTNLKCGSTDNRFAEFQKCRIKAVNRTHKYVDIYVRLHKVPVHNVAINLKLMRYDHGYKPFFIDLTFDACKFLKNQRNPVIIPFYEIYKNSSNMNHTCPYEHDLVVDRLWTGNLEMGFSKFLPMINGDYAVYSEWFNNNISRGFINVFLRLTGDKD